MVFLKRLGEISKETGIGINFIGHAGDGNLHPSVSSDPQNKEHFARAMGTIDRIIDMAIELGGVLSGEHGIGMAKMKYLGDELGQSGLNLMRSIKESLDPDYLLNPGKMVPLRGEA